MIDTIRKYIFLLLAILLNSALTRANAYSGKLSIYGKVYTIENGKRVPLETATVFLKNAGLYATTNSDGEYSFKNIDAGEYQFVVQLLGYKEIDRIISVSPNGQGNIGGSNPYDFKMERVSFRLDEVVVTAKSNRAENSTSSTISRQAIDHAQTSSLSDIMQFLPGVEFTNPNLSSSTSLNIRTLSNSTMNSLGTSIIVDGSPLSNNANMEGITTAMTGVSTTIAGTSVASAGSIPNSGVDVRGISTDNIESVEIIRGIPSAQYGDLTSGIVLINSKAGEEPFTLRVKTNPKIFQAFLSKGFKELHLSSDYAYGNAKTTEAYAYYQRFNFKTTWSKKIGDLNNNLSLSLNYGKDTRNNNPDDASSSIASAGESMGYRLNLSGTWNINRGWLKSVVYSISNAYTYKKSFYEQLCSNAVSLYSTNMNSGTTVSSIKGLRIYDADGKEVTNFSEDQKNVYGIYMPYSYFSHYDFYSKELNTFAKVHLNLFKSWGNLSNRVMAGGDFKSEGNVGKGLVFPEGTPPFRSTNSESGFRPRPLKDIPFLNQLGLFVEDNFRAKLFNRDFSLSAGLRYDLVNSLSILVPRLNVSYEIIPDLFEIKGGWGKAAKSPTINYLYPNKAYYDQTNYNHSAASNERENIVLSTTYIYDTKNPNLKMAVNRKAEGGFNLNILKKYKLSVTYFDELMRNGYTFGTDFSSIHWAEYKTYRQVGNDSNGYPILQLDRNTHRFFTCYMPLNTLYEHNYGVEWELDLGRFNSIRTSFFLNGAWMHSMNTSRGYSFDINLKNGSYVDSHYAVYEPEMRKYHNEKALTTLRITHNIPSIGFVVTLSSQLNLYAKSWTNYHNDEIPQLYINAEDGKVYPFTEQMAESSDYRYMLDQRASNRFIKERHKSTLVFNLNLSKEIKDFLTASFFVNNLFNSRPLDKSEVTRGAYTELNNPIYFGFEMKIRFFGRFAPSE